MSRLPIAMGLGLAVMAACADPDSPLRPDAAKVPSGPAVTAADPSYGRQGAAGLPVTITGSGFDQGSRASWERNGATDPKIAVVATQFVSSTQLIATIDIASDANLALYDVAVTTSLGRKGIGTEKFEVSTALAIAGTESAFGANERGEFAGRVGPPGAFYWSDAAGLVTVGTPGRAFDISEDGLTLTGFTGVCCQGAFVQMNVNGAWNLAVLPRDPAGSAYSSARAIASDPATGAAVIVGGLEAYLASGGNFSQAKARPRLWLAGAGGWTRVELPSPGGTTDSPLFDVNASGVAVTRSVVGPPSGRLTAEAAGPKLRSGHREVRPGRSTPAATSRSGLPRRRAAPRRSTGGEPAPHGPPSPSRVVAPKPATSTISAGSSPMVVRTETVVPRPSSRRPMGPRTSAS